MRIYYISKLDEQKALKLLYDNEKELIEFRDDIRNLKQIDINRTSKLLRIIGSEKSKTTAAWLETIFEFPDYIDKPVDEIYNNNNIHPATKKILNNSIAYVRKNTIYLKYKDAIVADIPYTELPFPETMMKFTDAINWISENIKNINFNDDKDLYLDEKSIYSKSNKYAGIYLSAFQEPIIGAVDHETFIGNNIKLQVESIVKSIDYEKMAEQLTKIPSNYSIYLTFTSNKTLNILNEISKIIKISEVKNVALRTLFKLIRKTNKPLISLAIVHYLAPSFEARCYGDFEKLEDFNEFLALINRIKKKKKMKLIKQIIKDGLRLVGDNIIINYDSTVQIKNIESIRWNIRFPKIYY
jgi:hypothetical protein